jgi:bacteriocin biosynthesis cyclodehydratase domain-containing protein
VPGLRHQPEPHSRQGLIPLAKRRAVPRGAARRRVSAGVSTGSSVGLWTTPAPVRATCQPGPMRVQIKPALRQVWRGPATLQIGLDPRHGTVLDGLTPADQALIRELSAGVDGALSRAQDSRHGELIDLLDQAGVLIRSRADRVLLGRLGSDRERWAPDAAALAVLDSAGGDGWALLAHRQRRTVAVGGGLGTGRTGAALTATLRRAGVGSVPAPDHADRSGPVDPPDLSVLVDPDAADARAALQLVAEDRPHLSVVVRETSIVVGPLVVPGRTACLTCLDRHRAARDPAWPRVLAQLTGGQGRGEVRAEESALAQLAASLAALQVLHFLDGDLAPDDLGPATLSATLEISLPDGLITRRPWPVHPSCGCQRLPELGQVGRVSPLD